MKDGYYWVRTKDTWIIAFYYNGKVLRIKANELQEIGDYIEMPDKYKDN